jgi:hypothetical protein
MDRLRDAEVEEEESFDEGSDAFPEEESDQAEAGDLVIVDDDLISSLLDGINSDNPVTLAQSVDVILGFLGYKESIIMDDDLTDPPIRTILPALSSHLIALFQSSKGGSVKRQKVTDLLEHLAPAVLDSFDQFKKSVDLFGTFCECLFELREHARPDTVTKAFLSVVRTGFQNPDLSDSLSALLDNMVCDPQYFPTTYQLIFRQFTGKANSQSIQSSVAQWIPFFMRHPDESARFVKSLIQRLSSALTDSLSQKEKTVVSWQTIATCELIGRYVQESTDERFLFPFFNVTTALLRNLQVRTFLPFQIKIALITHNLASASDTFVPLLSWIVDAIQFVCSTPPRGKAIISWEKDLLSPQIVSFDFCQQALDQLKRLFFADVARQCKSIAFPEFILPVKMRLVAIVKTARHNPIAGGVRTLLKSIEEQQRQLISIKRDLHWTKRGEQLDRWNERLNAVVTPLAAIVDREAQVAAQLEKMKPSGFGPRVTDNGDILEVATADDI